jgi:hypothetical protein
VHRYRTRIIALLAGLTAYAPQNVADPACPASARLTPVQNVTAARNVGWIDGKLIWPPGTPADEHVEVVLSALLVTGEEAPAWAEFICDGWYECDRTSVAPD